MVSAIGNGAAFKKARDFAAWRGGRHGNGQPVARPSMPLASTHMAVE